MRKLFICLAVLGVAGIALPVATPASAQDQTIVVKKDRDHDGWRHRHEWRRHNAKVVVIKKERRHRDHDHD